MEGLENKQSKVEKEGLLDMNKEEIERILCIRGQNWSSDENWAVRNYFFIAHKWFEKLSIRLQRGYDFHPRFAAEVHIQASEDDAKGIINNLYDKVEKSCSFDPNRLPGVLPIDRFEAFLWDRLGYTALDYFKKNPNWIESINELDSDSKATLKELAAPGKNPYEKLLEKEEKEENPKRHLKIAEECLAELPKAQQQAVRLWDFEGKSYEEMATITGVSNQGTLRKRVLDGRKMMIKLLEKRGIDYLKLIKEKKKREKEN